MKDIFLISDTHFQHENIIMYCGRPFKDSQHMDEVIIENWNSVVKPGDKVYHLGDVFFGDKERFKRLWPRLNGKKRLIIGNHDDIKFLSSGGFFEKVMLWRWFDELLLTHVPTHPSTLSEGRGGHSHAVNVHGHTHTQGSPVGPYHSVCVELINYTPVHIEDVKKATRRLLHD
jgi:calcineurin-like phosphoesterase family protein